MYGAMREHAPQSTRLAGALTAGVATLAFGYAMANGMGAYITQHVPDALIYVPLPDKPAVDPLPPPASDLPLSTDARDIISPLTNLESFTYDPDTLTGVPPTDTRRDTGPVSPLPSTPPTPIRTAAKMIPAASPAYPPADIRGDHQGTSSLEVCIDTAGRVTSASLAGSSGYGSLDQAALKWVRDRKFTPAKVDGQPQSICGHTVVYEWKLNRR